MFTKVRNKGFTLVEALVSIALITAIVTISFSVIGPWLEFKTNFDTKDKLEKVTKDFERLYYNQGFHIVGTSDTISLPMRTERGANLGTAFDFIASNKADADAAGSCPNLVGELQKIGGSLTDSPESIASDETGNNLCIFYYRNQPEYVNGAVSISGTIVLAYPGKDGVFDTQFNVANSQSIQIEGDDLVSFVNGADIQRQTIIEVVQHLDEISQGYSEYFKSRFAANPGRDITVYYFCNGYLIGGTTPVINAVGTPPRDYDNTSGVSCTSNTSVTDSAEQYTRPLRLLGTTGSESRRAPSYPGIRIITNNNPVLTGIVAIGPTGNLISQSFSAKTPQAAGTVPPYTALLYANLPGGALYVKTLVGNY